MWTRKLHRELLDKLCANPEGVVYQTLMKVADTLGQRNKFLVGLINVLKQLFFWLAHVKLDTHINECHPEFLNKLQTIQELMERATDTSESLYEFFNAVEKSGLPIAPPNPKDAANSGYVYCYLLKITGAGRH